jgi:hypothetical protein
LTHTGPISVQGEADEAEVEGKLPGFVALAGAIHEQMKWSVRGAQPTEQRAAFWRIVRLPVRQRER